ncbi:hypothetical protein TIFTF001_035215 [Ficus carica]|uniref:Uncharacterized protein n=1 Tax=Ficus carica TaxID=3494 RepID=A0AA88E1W0_FICCA|nr:hypothetical protein TIFTF001_035215 [Ficus carica]
MGYYYWVLVRCPKVTFSNRIGHHVSRGHITRESNLLLQFVGATNPSSSITSCSLIIMYMIRVRVGSWFELDWADRPDHSMAVRHVVLAEQKLTTYVYAVDKYGNGLRKAGRYSQEAPRGARLPNGCQEAPQGHQGPPTGARRPSRSLRA